MVKVALEECHHWLEGAEQPFLVLTNHKEYLKSAKCLNSMWQGENWDSCRGSGSGEATAEKCVVVVLSMKLCRCFTKS